MKNIQAITAVISILCITATMGSGAANTENPAEDTLSEKLFSNMDTNSDLRISKEEYFAFGERYMQVRGKPFNPSVAARNFAQFDKNGNGWIEPNDTHALSAYESGLLAEAREREQKKIVGVWQYWNQGKYGFITFVFTKDGEADMVNDGVSTRRLAQRHGGSMTYEYDPSTTPASLDIVVASGANRQYVTMMRCIVEFTEENRLRMRIASGKETIKRPAAFPEKDGNDTLTLRKMKSDTSGLQHF